MSQATDLRKEAMYEAMKKCLGVISQAAEVAGIHRDTHYLWIDNDPEYKKRIADIQNIKKDFVESKLMKLISEGDTAATIFAAKTLCKDRGYVERQELNGTMITAINIIETVAIGCGPVEANAN